MPDKAWDLEQIPWERFEPGKVDPEIVKIVKAAALVEYNGDDYAAYLCRVFQGDPAFQAAAKDWAADEVRHGEALGRWARLADPAFDFEAAVRRFRAGYRVPLEVERSVRGSRSGELVARCIVEVGTSSYYGSLAEAVEEPVLRQICQRIAADELRHYKLFYTHLKRYLERERIGRLRRLAIAAGRINETEDDELAYAYFAANAPADARYERRVWSEAYMGRALTIYRPKQVERATAMVCKAAGLEPRGRLSRLLARAAWYALRSRRARLAAA